MSIVLRVTIKIKIKSNAPYVGVYFIAISNNKYYVYAVNLP